jgi:MoxR-like ATPase
MAKSEISANRTVTPNEAKKSIRRAIKKQRPIFMWGAPGIGKSDIVRQIANENGRNVIDVRLPLWEPTDIKGIPYYNAVENTMSWAPPAELPSDPECTDVLFLDELNAAPPSVQAAAYQLILNRRVGTYVLPKGVSIVAAGNRETDKGVTYRMPAPLANRFVHLELRVDFDDWNQWATSNKIHKDVAGYLNYAKQDLYDFDPKSASRSFATPRTWSFVSELLDEDDDDIGTLTDLVAGCVGEGLAVKFMAHRKISGQLPNPSEILDGKVKELKIKEISAMYSLTIGMCYELDERHNKKAKDWDSMADNFFRFMMDNFPTEIVVMGAKTALTNFQLPFDPAEMKNFDEFHDRFGKYVITALEK